MLELINFARIKTKYPILCRSTMSYLEAIEQLFKIHYKTLKAYALSFVYDANIADDIVQDVFFELCNKPALIKFDKNVKSYLFKSVYNRSINYLKSKSTKSQISVGTTGFLENYLLQSQRTHEDNLIAKEMRKEIDIAIENLPVQCKKVFLLSRTYELKNREIAEQLDISVKSVEKHITKALSMIHTYLKQAGIFLLLYLLK